MTTSELVADLIVGAKKKSKIDKDTHPPNKRNKPTNLTKKGEDHWVKTMETYGKRARESGKKNEERYGNSNLGAWYVAMTIFEKSCVKHNIKPFTDEDTAASKQHLDIMGTRVRNASKQLSLKIGILARKLNNWNVLKGGKVLKEKFIDIYYKQGRYTIVTETIFNLIKDNDVDLPDLLRTKGLKKDKNLFVYTIMNEQKFYVKDERKKKQRIVITKRLRFTPEQIRITLNKDSEEMKDVDQVIKDLGKYVKKEIIQDKDISAGKHLLTGVLIEKEDNKGNVPAPGRFPVNFDEKLSDEEEVALGELVELIKKMPIGEIFYYYSIDTIHDLDTPLFQLHLVKALIEISKERKIKPALAWLDAVKDPTKYLDPEIYLKLEDEEDEEEEEAENPAITYG